MNGAGLLGQGTIITVSQKRNINASDVIQPINPVNDTEDGRAGVHPNGIRLVADRFLWFLGARSGLNSLRVLTGARACRF